MGFTLLCNHFQDELDWTWMEKIYSEEPLDTELADTWSPMGSAERIQKKSGRNLPLGYMCEMQFQGRNWTRAQNDSERIQGPKRSHHHWMLFTDTTAPMFIAKIAKRRSNCG